ncbi:MAG: helix-turn-helix domain-containing protein [Wolbachia pipientis]|nr:helix-turn-helix domain-containing protein [Wolbachia pipientis]
MQLGKKIKQLRLDRGLTQTELGKRIGVSYRQIQKYENGSNHILASRLYDLAKALSIDVADFFTDMQGVLNKLCQTEK